MLENQGVTHAFSIPSTIINSLFVALKHSKLKLLLCRHEQSRALMAACLWTTDRNNQSLHRYSRSGSHQSDDRACHSH